MISFELNKCNFPTLLFLVMVIASMSSCANYQLNYANDKWAEDIAPPISEVKERVYLIGDCGNADYDSLQKAVFLLRPALAENEVDDENTSVVYLGDNIYPDGLAPEGHPDRLLGEVRLQTQINTVKRFRGHIRMVPGNHDWYDYGREGLARQEKLIEDGIAKDHPYHTDHDYFQPSNGCGDVEVSQVGDVNIVAIDSHWWLEAHDDGYDWSNCDVQDKVQFEARIRETFDNLKGEDVILTMHHPTHTNGKHNGNFRLKEVLFPTSELYSLLYLPLPLTGYVYSKMRAFVTPQDNKNATNRALQNLTKEIAAEHGQTIVAAGHEHNIQYFYTDDINFIVSGSGSKKSAVAMIGGSEFSYGHYGYAVLDYYNDGSRWVKFYSPNKETNKLEEVFRKKLIYKTELPPADQQVNN